MENTASNIRRQQRRYCSQSQYWLLVLLVPILVFLLGAGALTTQAHTSQSQFDTIQAAVATQPTYVTGDTFRIGNLLYKVTSVRTVSPDSDLIKSPRYGNTFLIIGLTITNQSQANVEVRSIIGFNLKDLDGQKQEPSMGAILAVKDPIDGTIKAGETVTGEIGYEIKKEVQTFDLAVIPDPLSSKTQVAAVRISVK